MQNIKEIFKANIKKLLTANGWSYAKLADECTTPKKLSRAYVNSFRNGINPSLEIVETVANAFGITVQKLLDPNLEYNRVENDLPPGYGRHEVLLTDLQYFEVQGWEENNKKFVEQYRHQAYLRQLELSK